MSLEICSQLNTARRILISYFDFTVNSTVLYSGRHKLLMYCIPTTQKHTHYSQPLNCSSLSFVWIQSSYWQSAVTTIHSIITQSPVHTLDNAMATHWQDVWLTDIHQRIATWQYCIKTKYHHYVGAQSFLFSKTIHNCKILALSVWRAFWWSTMWLLYHSIFLQNY